MGTVPREEFLPAHLQEYAYEDTPLPIGEAQTISQHYIVAFMTEALGLSGGEKVLEIGARSGYAAAILSRIAGEVFTVERIGNSQPRRQRSLPISATAMCMCCTPMARGAGPSMHPTMPSSWRQVGPMYQSCLLYTSPSPRD